MTNYSWKTAVTGNWITAADWTPGGGPPTNMDNVTLGALGAAYVVQVSSADAASTLTLSDSKAGLSIFGAAGSLAIGGAVTMSAGALNVATSNNAAGKMSVGGAFTLSGGTVNVNSGGTLTLSGTLSQSNGTINLNSGGTFSGGTIQSTGGKIVWAGGSLSGVTFDGPLTLSTSSSSVHIASGTSVVGSNGSGTGTINVGGGNSDLYFDGTQTVSNTIINLAYDNTYGNYLYQYDPSSSSETLTFAANTTVNMDYYGVNIYAYDTIVSAGIINDNESVASYSYIQGNSFTNQGTINAKSADDNLYINPTNFTNSGLIDIANGGFVYIAPTNFTTTASSVIKVEANSSIQITATDDWTNLGSITVGSGGAGYLSDTVSAASLGNFVNSGGKVYIYGTFDNSGGTLDGSASFGQLTLDGGTISGGTATSAGLNFGGSDADNTLSGVTFDGPLNLSAANTYLHLANGAQVVGSSGSGTINVGGSYSAIFFDGTQIVSNTTINLGDDSTYQNYLSEYDPTNAGDETLTLAVSTAVNMDYYSSYIYAHDSIVNAGVVDDNQTISSASYIQGNSFTNQGTINAKSVDDSFYIDPTNFTNSGLIDIANGGFVYINPTNFTTTASSVIKVEANSSIQITATDDWTNLGSITVASGGGVYLSDTVTAASLGNFVNSGGNVYIYGTYDNTGGTLDGSASFGRLTLDGGTISGGTATAAGLDFGGSDADNTLSGVTFDGPLNLSAANTYLHLANGAQVVGSSGPGTINVGGGYSAIFFDGTQTVSNTTINLGDDGTYQNYLSEYDPTNAGDETLTLAVSTTVNMDYYSSYIYAHDSIVNAGVVDDNQTISSTSYIQGNSFTNQGTINAKSVDDNLYVDPTTFSNSGLIDIANGGAVNINATTFTNLASRTLMGGTYEVEAGSTLDIYATSTTTIATLKADVILSGTGSVFTQYQTNTGTYATFDSTLRTIASTGELQLLNGRNWTTNNAPIINNGIIFLGGAGGGTVTSTGASATLTNATGARIVGNGTVNANTFSNSGTIEAKGGTLTLHQSVTGSGTSQIDANATLIVAQGLSGTALFDGDDATLEINTPASFTATVGGFSLLDTIFLPGVTANSASVISNQLVVKNGASTVATLNLNGAYSNFYFLTLAVSGGTDIVALPVPPTVAQYLAAVSDYDLIPGGFTISDIATNIAANIGSLNDSHINSITSTSGVVTVSVSTFSVDQSTLDKISGGFAISDTAGDLSAALNSLTDPKITSLIVFDNNPVQVSVAQLTSDSTQIGLLTDAGGGAASLAVYDTAADISGDLANLNGANIASITISDNDDVVVSVGELASHAIAVLQNQNGSPYQLAVDDSVGNVQNGLATLQSDVAHIASITATGGVVSVNETTFAADQGALDKVVGGFDVSDTLPNVVSGLSLFNADAHIAALMATSGTATLSGGVGVNAPAFALSGSSTALTLSENLSYAGALGVGSGSKISVSTGDALTETGALSLSGSLTGTGGLKQTGGSEAIASGATISTATWSVTGAAVNLNGNLTYTGPFTAGAGDTLTLNGANLTLKGATTLTSATTTGSGRLLTQAATTVSGGLTIGGTGGVTNSATFTQSGGNVTLGDAAAGDKATFSNLSTGVWNITDASGVALGANTASSITNQGTFEKTAGATSTVAASFNNQGGTVYAKVGIIAFAGPVTTMAGLLEGGAVQFTNGATSFTTGANATVSQMSLSGASSMTIAASLTYAGKFTQSTGTTLSINTGQVLTLTGAVTLNGVVHGAGELLLQNGTLAFGVGGPMAPGSWSSNNETITMTGSRGFSGTFTGGAGDVFNLNGGALTLTGATTLSGTTTAGTSLLTVAGATTISGGVAIGGTAGLVNKGAVSESGGNLTLGDAAGHKATLTNMAAHSWNLTDDSGVALGNASSGSTIANAGLFEKTGGTSTTGSAIAPGITNTGTIEAASGLLDLQGAIIGTGKDIVSGASTLEFDSTVAGGQTASFSGSGSTLELLDPQGFAGKLSGFDTVGSSDTLELSNAWTYTGFTENAGHTQGTMTFADGGQTASILFLGNYTSGLFQPTTNTSGTFVTYA